jgi:hypothetical protein
MTQRHQKAYWCCTADFGEHEPTCENYVPPQEDAALIQELFAEPDHEHKLCAHGNCEECNGCGMCDDAMMREATYGFNGNE